MFLHTFLLYKILSGLLYAAEVRANQANVLICEWHNMLCHDAYDLLDLCLKASSDT